MIGQDASTSALDAFARDAAALRARVADLERALPGLSRGKLALATTTATTWTNATTTESDMTASAGAAPALTLALSTSRRYRWHFQGRFSVNAANVSGLVRFVENGVSRISTVYNLGGSGAPAVTVYSIGTFVPASASSVVYKMTGSIATGSLGSGTISGLASSGTPWQFWIEDIGLA